MHHETPPNDQPLASQHVTARIADRIALALVVLGIGALASLTDTARAAPSGSTHYPDLLPFPPLGLLVERHGGMRELRFDTAIANLGLGPSEVFPRNNAATGATDAFQRLFTHNAAGEWQVTEERFVGTFVFHPDHDHWHVEAFVAYELRDAAPDGSPGPNILASSPKVSFCLRDSWQVTSDIEHAMPQTYFECTADGPQGIAVGWADIYTRDLAGQSLDISALREGTYWLIITADPVNVLAEGGGAAEANNTNGTKFRLSHNGWRIEILRYGL